MSTNPLLTYLRDHLAGARGALELLAYLREHAADPEIRVAADNFHFEIAADREVLEQLTIQLGGGTSIVKEISAWLMEKLSRLKIGSVGEAVDLPLLEAVEALALGILGKVALWDALIAIAREDRTLPRLDYYSLRDRAQHQHDRMELHRLRLVTLVLTSDPVAAK